MEQVSKTAHLLQSQNNVSHRTTSNTSPSHLEAHTGEPRDSLDTAAEVSRVMLLAGKEGVVELPLLH
jgi:hypothetical protein